MNQGLQFPSNTILVTIDVQGAYQNIPQEDGIKDIQEAFEERKYKEIPSQLISMLMELIIFEYHNGLYQQLICTTMGSKPSYANIYLAKKVDHERERLGFKYGNRTSSTFQIQKRFLDDLFIIFKGTTKNLHELLQEINEVHPTSKL